MRGAEANEPVEMQQEPLVCVVAVLRSYCSFSGNEIGALPHVVELVERTCEQGFGVRMLKRLTAREESGVDPFYRAFLTGKGLVAAARNDNLDVVRWICEEYCPSVIPVKAVVEAASCGRLRVLQWLFERYPSVRPTSYLAEKAVRGGHLAVLQWLEPVFKTSADVIGDLLTTAATHGHLEIMQWLYELQRQLGGSRNLERERNDQSVHLANAITSGHFDVARFLADQGCTLQEDLSGGVRFCAMSGDLEMVKWLHARQLTDIAGDWIPEAAAAGHLDIVKWIHENVPAASSSVKAMDGAARNGHLDVIQWLHANRTEGCTRYALEEAADGGHLETVKWLHEHPVNGAQRGEELDLPNSLPVLRWLYEYRGSTCTRNAMANAAQVGNFEKLLFLKERNLGECTQLTVDVAVQNAHFEVVRWLLVNYPAVVDAGAVQRSLSSTSTYKALIAMFHQFKPKVQ